MTVVDLWANTRSPAAAAAWRDTPVLRGVTSHFGTSDPWELRAAAETLHDMDEAGVEMSVVTGMAGVDPVYPQGNYEIDEVLTWCEQHPTRLRAALTVAGLGSVRFICRRIEELASHPALVLVRVIPILVNEAINSPRLYPVYERCEALGLAVSVNVGVPGPKMRVRYQDPMLLDDVLIDFPDLTVVAAHMGHPWEQLLIRFMRKYERLHLTNSAWLAKYIEPSVLRFMDSSAGRDRLLFASDAPMISPQRAVAAARELPISTEAMAAFLGGNAFRVLRLDERPMTAATAPLAARPS